MKEIPENWGCPDWRDRESYPSNPDDIEDWEWRWQFMRRWPFYRKLYFSLPRMPAWEPELEFDPDDDCRGLGNAGFSVKEKGDIQQS